MIGTYAEVRSLIWPATRSLIESTTPPPWHQRQTSYGMKVLLTFVAILLASLLAVSVVMWIFLMPDEIAHGPARHVALSSIIMGVVSTVMLVGSLFGLIKLWPYLVAPTGFQPSYGVIPADVAGHPFEVVYRRAGRGRSMSARNSRRARGTVRFDADSLLIDGYLVPHPVTRLCVALALTIVPLIVLKIGLGLIPALRVASYIGCEKITRPIAYSTISDLSVQGCTVTFTNAGVVPKRVSFFVSAPDGERLYRELQAPMLLFPMLS